MYGVLDNNDHGKSKRRREQSFETKIFTTLVSFLFSSMEFYYCMTIYLTL